MGQKAFGMTPQANGIISVKIMAVCPGYRAKHPLLYYSGYQREMANGAVSLRLGSSWNEFKWGCKFADGLSMARNLQQNLFWKLDA